MTFFAKSDISRSSIGSDFLKQDDAHGFFLPTPASIWGSGRRSTMLETITCIWKLLVLRPCLFRRGDLTAREAYLPNHEWRNITNRNNVDTTHSAMWREGKRELWGKHFQPLVAQHVQAADGEPTLKKMDCRLHCSPIGKFDDRNDADKKLEHAVLFRLAELHVLQDFASYHPNLQRIVDGRWCPPPFDAQDALDDRPKAFPGLRVQVDDEEENAMQEILAVVRWNGLDGVRGWEMADGPDYRAWLTALRALLDRCPTAWDDNRILNDSSAHHPELNLLTCDLARPDAPVKTVSWVLTCTHIILCMRAGRVPTCWFNKPALMDLSICNHGLA